ncbi:MAG: DsbA family protein [Rhodobacteraceae bacterium]|nr:DsbA family protein [Paracoccaceae bacterium]
MDMALGNPEAGVTLIEYASFTCPHCANFAATVFPELKTAYIDTGKVRFIHREVYFDRFGLWAGMLARCGGEERYFGFADMIYAQQRQWAGSADPATVADNLRRMGRVAGLTDEQVNACLNDRAAAEALVAAFQTNATRDGVQATPTLILNGTKHSNMSFQELAQLIDAALAK